MRGTQIVMLLAGCALAPAPAAATDVAARLQALEAEIAQLRAELAARPAAAEPPPAMPPALPAPRAATAELTAGGFVKSWAAVSRYGGGTLPPGALGRDFWLPQQLPVGGPASTHVNAHVKQTRLWVKARHQVADVPVSATVEADFQTAPGTQGTERTTNGYQPALRRAFITLGEGPGGTLLIGQEWSTFQYVPALPETTDFIGPTEGSVFARQPQIRYTRPIGQSLQLALALENPAAATISSQSAAMIEHDDDQWPDAVARLAFRQGKAEVTLAGLIHPLTVAAGAHTHRALGWGLSLAGRIPFGPDGRHGFSFMANRGVGIGQYLGLNFAADAVLAEGEAGTPMLARVGVVSGFAALKLGWNRHWRSTIMASVQEVDYRLTAVPAAANAGAFSLAANLFTTPLQGFDVGVEVRHGERRLVSGARGTLDRFELAARYAF